MNSWEFNEMHAMLPKYNQTIAIINNKKESDLAGCGWLLFTCARGCGFSE